MNKTLLNTAIATVLGAASFGANADLQDGDTLSITGFGTEVTGCILGTPLPCAVPALNITAATGSFFNLGSDTYIDSAGTTGLILGAPGGQGIGDIDNAWPFNGSDGHHYTSFTADSPFVVGGSIVGTGTIDMAGWTVNWNGADIDMSGDPAQGNTGLATISCGTCEDGDAYTLDYAANVPLTFLAFAGAPYTLHLEGFITSTHPHSAVPVPAAVWLFGSGLLGLVGVARRKAKA